MAEMAEWDALKIFVLIHIFFIIFTVCVVFISRVANPGILLRGI